MARVVDIATASAGFMLTSTLRATGAEVVLEELVPTADQIVPTVHVTDTSTAAFEAAADEDPSVASVERLAADSDDALYRVTWSSVDGGVLGPIRDANGTILSGRGSEDGWEFTVRFAEGTELSSFLADCVTHDVDVDVQRVARTDADPNGRPFADALTDRQHAALTTAYHAGYFDVPRRATQADLAEQLDVAPQSVSELIRRAVGKLVDETLIADSP
ncbi:helix-turn-helix domain-containing protein [Halobaculum sp. D14]|uniref:helix-turn-helix domain-containing protein n=1 Tax=Halobaculum sp. D14 TaxID=3421642 RepID=UPI003EBF62B3